MFLNAINWRLSGDTLLAKSAAMAVARGINILAGFVLAVVLAGSLGATGYGTYLFILATAQMLAMPSMMGLPALLTRQIAIYADAAQYAHIIGIVRWGLAIVLGAAALIAVGLGAALIARSPFGGPHLSTTYSICIVLFVLGTGLMSWASAILNGFRRPVWSSLPDGVIRPVTLLAAVVTFALLGQLTPAAAIGLHIVAILVAFFWAVLAAWRHCDFGTATPIRAKATYESAVWFSGLWPLFLTVAATTINGKLDMVMLGVLKSPGDVAVYGLAVQIAALVIVPQTILNTIVAPRIAAAGKTPNMSDLQKTLSSVCGASCLGALTVMIGLVFIGPPMIRLFFGPDFQTSYNLLILLSFGHVVVCAMGPAMIALNMLHQERHVAAIVVASGGANVLLNMVLIPTYGGMGAATATLITIIGLQVACAVTLYRIFRLKSWVPLRVPSALGDKEERAA
ncbi:MAG: flippase [Pseudomonadota bacterium]